MCYELVGIFWCHQAYFSHMYTNSTCYYPPLRLCNCCMRLHLLFTTPNNKYINWYTLCIFHIIGLQKAQYEIWLFSHRVTVQTTAGNRLDILGCPAILPHSLTLVLFIDICKNIIDNRTELVWPKPTATEHLSFTAQQFNSYGMPGLTIIYKQLIDPHNQDT